MSDANRTAFAIVEEVVPGTTPAAPAFERIRTTGGGLKADPKTIESDELSADLNVTDVPIVGLEPNASIPVEMIYDNLATPMEGLLRSRWVNTPVRNNNGTADSIITDVTATDVAILAAAGTKYNQGVFALGHLVRTTGFTNAGNNALRRAGAGTGAVVIKLAGGTIEAAPPGTARAKVVGFEGAAGDVTAAANGLASTVLDFTTLGLIKGQWIKIGGSGAGEKFSGTPANNDYARITDIAANLLSLDNLPTGWAVDAGAAKTIRVWLSDCLTNGTTPISYSLEEQYQDLDVPEFQYESGARANKLSIDIPKKDKIKATLEFVGLNHASQTARFTAATDVAAVTGDVMNTSSNVARIAENGARIIGPNYVTGLKLSFDNGLRRNDAVGSIGSVKLGDSRLKLTGTADTYYGSKAIRDKILNNTATALNVVLTDPNGTRAMVFDMPRVKFTAGDPTVPGVDSDRMLPASLQAIRHLTLLYTVRVCRFEEFAS